MAIYLPKSLVTAVALLPLVALSVLPAACSDDDPAPTGDGGTNNTGDGGGGGNGDGGGGGGGSGCGGLCKTAGFADGTESKFDGNITECQCTGTGGAVTKASCEAYCAPFGVGADKAFLTTEVAPDDKCVCDGT